MRPPRSFYDFTLQLHQDLDLIYPGWASDAPDGRHEFYEDFRQQFGDRAVRDLADFFGRLRRDPNTDLEGFWARESKADWILPPEGLLHLFEDFEAWAMMPRP